MAVMEENVKNFKLYKKSPVQYPENIISNTICEFCYGKVNAEASMCSCFGS